MSDSASTNSPRAPRRGFYWQDIFATRELVRCALEPEAGIDGVNVEAYGAAHADDVVICKQGHRTYLQLKHSVDGEGRYVASDLFGISDGASVFAKLFITYQTVKGADPFEIQLHTNRSASTTTKKGNITPSDLESKLLSLLRADPKFQPTAEWDSVLSDLQAKAGANSRDELLAFLRHLRLVFEAPGVDALEDEIVSLISRRFTLSRDEARNVADALAKRVYGIATDATHGRTPLSRLEILDLIRRCAGIESRRVGHFLDLPENHLPREAFARDVLDRIDATSSGYVLVTGPPGCGKTTFATWLADTYPERVLLRYHAFHPRASSDVDRRWRLSDLGLVDELLGALRDRFPTEISYQSPSKEGLHSALIALYAELAKLGARKKWVLIIDGLDHVVRSGLAQHDSLFGALREVLPPNIVVLLLGQPGWPYPPWLTTCATLSFPALSEDECGELVGSSFGGETSSEREAFVSRLYMRSQGNPLSVYYTLEALVGLSSTEASSRLDGLKIGPDLNVFYRELRDGLRGLLPKAVDSSTLLPELYAFFALATVPITPERLMRAFPEDFEKTRLARDTLEAMRPILVPEGDKGFRLFHDDFRRFVEHDLDDDARAETHRRHATALRTTATGDEFENLAEHLWLGGDDAELSALPFSRSLAEWLATCGLDALISIHRLALAAALRLGDTHLAIRVSLALRRVNELDTAEDDDDRISLTEWLFKIPPLEVGHRATEVRHRAIDAACRGFQRDPVGARTVVARFLRATPKEARRDLEYHILNWWLCSGEIERLEGVAKRFGDGRQNNELVTAYASHTRDLVQLQAAASRLGPHGGWWAAGFSGVALKSFIASDVRRAHALIDALVPLHAKLDDVTARMVAFLSHLHGERVVASPALLQPTVDKHSPESYPDLDRFTHGWSLARYGTETDIDAIQVPSQLRTTRDHWMPRFSEWLFKVGVFIGLFQRNPKLVSPSNVERLWGETKAQGNNYHDQKWRREARAQMAILMAITCRADDRLRPVLLDKVTLEIQRSLPRPDQEDYPYFDALWFLDEARWLSLARDITSGSVPSFHDEYLRHSWCEHWLSRAETRGLTVPDSFKKVARIARLGIPRKTNPFDLALAAFEQITWSDTLAAALSELCDLQVRAAHYSEATRYTADNLAPVLARALRHAPALFESEYRHVVSSLHMDVSDVLPSRIAHAFLADGVDGVATRVLEALWWWVASCPDSFEGNGKGREVAATIAATHNARTESQLENVVRSWARAYTPSSDSTDDVAARSAPTDDGLDSQPHAPEDVGDIEPEWLSKWFSPEHFERRKPLLRREYRKALATLAQGVASRKWRLYELHSLAEGLPDVAPDVDWHQVLRLSLEDIRERVALQPEHARSTRPTHDDHDSALLSLMLGGLDSRDILTVEFTLRSAAAAARSPRLSEALQRELVPRLQDPEDRRVEYALALVPHLVKRQPWFDEALAGLSTHPHACVRMMTARALGVPVAWDLPADTMPILAMPALAEYGTPQPDTQLPGMAFYGDAESVLRKYATSLVRILGGAEVTHLGAMKSVLATLPAPTVHHHAPPTRAGGFALSPHRAHDAAARYVTRVARDVETDALHQALSFLAPFDAWLITTAPSSLLSDSHVALCTFEQRWSTHAVDAGLTMARWRVLTLVPKDGALSEATIEAAFEQIVRSDTATAFVTQMGPGDMETGVRQQGVFAFGPKNLTSIPSGMMELAPCWDQPMFDGLTYRGGTTPGWFTDEGEAVVRPFRIETREEENGRRARRLVSGWTIERRFVESVLERHPARRPMELSRHESKGGGEYEAIEIDTSSLLTRTGGSS